MPRFISSKPFKFDPSKEYPAVMYANELFVEVDRNSRTVTLVNVRDTSLEIGVDASSEDKPLGFTKRIPSGIMDHLKNKAKKEQYGFHGVFKQG